MSTETSIIPNITKNDSPGIVDLTSETRSSTELSSLKFQQRPLVNLPPVEERLEREIKSQQTYLISQKFVLDRLPNDMDSGNEVGEKTGMDHPRGIFSSHKKTEEHQEEKQKNEDSSNINLPPPTVKPIQPQMSAQEISPGEGHPENDLFNNPNSLERSVKNELNKLPGVEYDNEPKTSNETTSSETTSKRIGGDRGGVSPSEPLKEHSLPLQESEDDDIESLRYILSEATKLVTSTKRGHVGLSCLPHRLNSIERVRNDPELQRVFRGKYENEYKFIPVKKKTVGMAMGTIYEKEHTCPKSEGKKKKLWLGKIGFKGEDRLGEHSKMSYPTIHNKRAYNLDVTVEYIASCLYRVFSDGTFETPKCRLSELPVCNKFYPISNFEIQVLVKRNKLDTAFQIMSKWCEEYRDLGELKVRCNDGKVVEFIEFVKTFRSVPENVVVEENSMEKEVPLIGVMGLLATSTTLGDIDVLGGSGGNAGFVVIRNDKDEIISINVVKVDPGYSFRYDHVRGKVETYGGEVESYEILSDPRDIRFCTNLKCVIEWNRLSDEQKHQFLEVKLHHLEVINSKETLEYIFFRDGKFNLQGTQLKVDPKVANELIYELRNHVLEEEKLYNEDIREFLGKRENFLENKLKSCEEIGDFDRSLSYVEKLIGVYLMKERDDMQQISRLFDYLGGIHGDRGEHEKANKYYKKAVATKLKSLPENHPSIATTYASLGNVFYHQGEYDRAKDFYNKALTIYLKSLPENHLSIATTYGNLGNVFSKQGEHSKAKEFYNKALAIKLKSSPENYPSIATTYVNLGDAFAGQGEYNKAIDFFNKALAVELKSLHENHPSIATTYGNLGTTFLLQGDYKRAIEFFKKTLAIQLKSLPENHPLIATSYNNLGNLFSEKGEYNKAKDFFNKALGIQLKTLPENHPSIAANYGNLGNVFCQQGELNKAKDFLNKGLTIQLKSLPENHPDIGKSYVSLGLVLLRKGEYEKAKDFYNKGLAIELKSLPENHPSIAISYGNLGNVFFKQGEYSKAKDFHDKALAIKLKSSPENYPSIAISYGSLGNVFFRQGEYNKAKDFFNKALGIQLKTLPENHPDIATLYNNLGGVFYQQGENNKAADFYNKALEITLKSLPENHMSIATSYNNLGNIFSEQREFSKAIVFYNKTLAIQLKLLPENHPSFTTSYINIAGLYFVQKNYGDALNFFSKAYDVNRAVFGNEHQLSIFSFKGVYRSARQILLNNVFIRAYLRVI